MNGPEHYREAERLMGNLAKMQDAALARRSNGATIAAATDAILAEAQVHATLALVAATVLTADMAADVHNASDPVRSVGVSPAWMGPTQ